MEMHTDFITSFVKWSVTFGGTELVDSDFPYKM